MAVLYRIRLTPLVLLTFVLSGYVRQEYKLYIPVVVSDHCFRVRENVGAAYGWGIKDVSHPQKLCIGFYHIWSINRGDESVPVNSDAGYLLYAPHYWSDCLTGYGEEFCTYNDDIAKFCQHTPITEGVITYQGKPLITFMNEPDINLQANKSPAETIALYQNIKNICGDKVLFFGPGVSAVDRVCHRNSLYPEQIPDWYPELEQKYPDWCWLREYLSLAQEYGIQMDGYAFHHYPVEQKHIPNMDWDFNHVYKSILAAIHEYDKRENIGFVVMELGSCNENILARDLRQSRANPAILYIAGWLPNAPDDSGFYCNSFFKPYGSGELSPVGLSFVRN